MNYWDNNGGSNWSLYEISIDTTNGSYATISRAQQWYEECNWQFTPQTQFAISPVHEPASYAMLAAGPTLLSIRRRRNNAA